MFTTKLAPLEFNVLRAISPLELRGQRLLLACSGGLDSCSLLNILVKLRHRLNFELAVAYVHHGKAANEVFRAREDQRAQVAKLAESHGLEFFALGYQAQSDEHAPELTSEASLRKFRLKLLDDLRMEGHFNKVVFAHHADDLFETRLIRLIRGTSLTGLRAMQLQTQTKLRPLLAISRAELEHYAQAEKLVWIDDPSNQDLAPFRNWLRHHWLRDLEAKRPGGKQALARSLKTIVEMSGCAEIGQQNANRSNSEALNRQDFVNLSATQKRNVLADFIRAKGIEEFSRNHLDEIKKRIESVSADRRKPVRFEILQLEWAISKTEITARRTLV